MRKKKLNWTYCIKIAVLSIMDRGWPIHLLNSCWFESMSNFELLKANESADLFSNQVEMPDNATLMVLQCLKIKLQIHSLILLVNTCTCGGWLPCICHRWKSLTASNFYILHLLWRSRSSFLGFSSSQLSCHCVADISFERLVQRLGTIW